MCDKGFLWNPSNYECECDKSCEIEEYVDYKNCKCRRKIFGELVQECSKNIDENKRIYNGTFNLILLDAISLNDYKKVCGSYALYFALFALF